MSLIIIFSILTILVLATGVILMAYGGDLNKKYSTKLMSLRVFFQAMVITVLAFLYLYSTK
ncbi:MAG: HIG1 domain-containing protein [Rickettsiaceae bacterium]|nr:HIG1 domain-containing protein [Rickettsiaceae bacterium]